MEDEENCERPDIVVHFNRNPKLKVWKVGESNAEFERPLEFPGLLVEALQAAASRKFTPAAPPFSVSVPPGDPAAKWGRAAPLQPTAVLAQQS